ncbi:type II toxin-antitoxin system RelE/ParE family toxin [Gelidibacter sp.]|uniref:type II toxin-antitoxin system RelE/ParE family toxin n=1 Tax=Gelidibacter sp. TaxID=2018083 RepID=UPI002BEE8142|nr:type II toxin-antitoxin system RelE/ParE family toxin [Gelidibacter sp.]HUH26665.1 type II toxin-antitoxin system RelE/ParE family toxin [Gelidibacter sp.]
MEYKIIILPLAQKEIDNALVWYESKQKGLGADFLTYLGGYFLAIRQGFAIYQVKRKPYFRELPLKRFPFVIIYEINGDEIIIFSVFNVHQDPNKKLKS